MRVRLVVNPAATTTNARTREVITRALSAGADLDVVETDHRGHAAALAQEAAKEGYDAVIAHGGDGTVNEVVNGLLADGPGADRPRLGVVPGGSTNVFARALEIPDEPIEATGALLDSLAADSTRLISLGRADERWFTFGAGLGLDADVVATVERARQAGARSTHALYVRAILRRYWSEHRDSPLLTVTDPTTGEELGEVHLLVAQNTSPWTFLGRRPLNLCPEASFETGLDAFLLRRLRTASTLRLSQQLLRGADPRSKHVAVLHDRSTLTVTSDRPVPHQVDGDYLGHREQVTLSSHPEALRVLV